MSECKRDMYMMLQAGLEAEILDRTSCALAVSILDALRTANVPRRVALFSLLFPNDGERMYKIGTEEIYKPTKA